MPRSIGLRSLTLSFLNAFISYDRFCQFLLSKTPQLQCRHWPFRQNRQDNFIPTEAMRMCKRCKTKKVDTISIVTSFYRVYLPPLFVYSPLPCFFFSFSFVEKRTKGVKVASQKCSFSFLLCPICWAIGGKGDGCKTLHRPTARPTDQSYLFIVAGCCYC